jgi:hypothetical protein
MVAMAGHAEVRHARVRSGRALPHEGLEDPAPHAESEVVLHPVQRAELGGVLERHGSL